MKNQNILDERAVGAKSNKNLFEKLLMDYKPFVYAQVKKSMGYTYIDEHDDAASIGIIAFYEAIQAYNPDNGHFLPFASVVIRRRVIDYLRKNPAASQATVCADLYDEDSNLPALGDDAAARQLELVTERSALREEIERLNRELRKWEITMEDVYKGSPRHKAGRKMISQVVTEILADKDCLEILLQKKYLPLKKILENVKIPRKNLEKSRNYIIACVLIVLGNYPMIKEYLDLEKKTC